MKQTNQKRRQILAAGTAAAATLGFPSVLRAQAGPLKVGVILPLSGVLSFPGLQTRRGTELGAKMMADEGVRLDVTFVDT